MESKKRYIELPEEKIKEIKGEVIDNFLEISTTKEANEVNLEDYTFLERLSAKRGTYCFKIRENKRT